jgi:hypothetical protein
LYTHHDPEAAEQMNRAISLLALAVVSHAATSCSHDIAVDGSLLDMASRYLGSPRFAISIALATNSRSSAGFQYISNPDDLTGIGHLCVPSKSEARLLLRNWEAFDKAVSGARLPRTSGISNELVTISPDQPVTVVTWIRAPQAEQLKTSRGSVIAAADYTWVTVEPHLQQFCSAFVRDYKPNEAALTRRLEQRLGLSPASSKAYFVRLRLEHPDSGVVFRPCGDPTPSGGHCSVGLPAKASAEYQQWLLNQYYVSYGRSLISEAPWTSLGYTFDWAPHRPSGYERFGESEFVIRKGAAIEIKDVVTTMQYCAAQQETTTAALR